MATHVTEREVGTFWELLRAIMLAFYFLFWKLYWGSWGLEDNVVCSQPARNLSRPDGLEDPEDSKEDENVSTAPDPASKRVHGAGFCFDSSFDVHKKCPLCELMFPPNYDQSKFEEHVESHWKVCPVCSEQFPPDYDQQGFERHVHTHFDQNVLNFE